MSKYDIDVEQYVTITLGSAESDALKNALGSFSDSEFNEKGIYGDNREILRDIYNSLPCGDDDD